MIATAPSAQQVTEGNGATLFCNATANPPPSTAWTKQGSNTVLSSSETLSLTNLMRGDNGAVYKCKVENNLGSAEAYATIIVLCKCVDWISLYIVYMVGDYCSSWVLSLRTQKAPVVPAHEYLQKK